MTRRGSRPAPRLGHLVLKPELACTAACPTCSSRKALHRSVDRRRFLDLNDWRALFREADGLGCSRLTISGGEPTLYARLEELIALGKAHGWEVDLNTNGSRIDRSAARRLVDAGLDAALVSVYAADAGLHDRLRRSPGLWQRAQTALAALVEERDRRAPGLRVGIQTVLSKDNFCAFPELLAGAYRLRACAVSFSYLEGDYAERRFLLDRSDISEFKRQVIPRALAVIRAARTALWPRRLAMAAVRSLYKGNARQESDFARGIYRRPRPCPIPSFQSLVLANGDVHPCNMVEYTHQPVIGNLRDRSLSELWQDRAWEDFRRQGFDLCRYCPMPRQVAIPITRGPRHVLLYAALTATPLRRFKLGIRGWSLSHARPNARQRSEPCP